MEVGCRAMTVHFFKKYTFVQLHVIFVAPVVSSISRFSPKVPSAPPPVACRVAAGRLGAHTDEELIARCVLRSVLLPGIQPARDEGSIMHRSQQVEWAGEPRDPDGQAVAPATEARGLDDRQEAEDRKGAARGVDPWPLGLHFEKI